jgi:hypothetical protein
MHDHQRHHLQCLQQTRGCRLFIIYLPHNYITLLSDSRSYIREYRTESFLSLSLLLPNSMGHHKIFLDINDTIDGELWP